MPLMSTFRGILAPPASVSSGSGNESKKSAGWLGGSRRDEAGESARRSRRTSGGRKASGGGGCDLAGCDLAGWDLAGWDLAGWDWLGWEDEGSDGSGGRAGEDQASVGGIFTNAAPAADIPIATSSRQPRGWTGIAQVRPAFLPSLLAAGRYRTPGMYGNLQIVANQRFSRPELSPFRCGFAMQLRRVVALLALGGCEALVVSPSLIERSAWRHSPTTRRTSTPFLAQTPESLSPPGSAAALDDEQTRELASAVDAAAALEEPTTSPSTTAVSTTSGPDQLLPKEPEADTGVWRLVVLGLTVLWASNFAVIKLIFQECPDLHASEYAALRFAIAAVALLPALAKGLKSAATRAATKGGLEIGGWISLGYFGQAIGLLTTTANKSAFICSLHVIWVAAITSVIKSDVEKKATLPNTVTLIP